jgi:hypothetical protein
MKIPVADTGWFDLKVAGLTVGTKVSSPCDFEVLAGEFGVYMIDSSQRTK